MAVWLSRFGGENLAKASDRRDARAASTGECQRDTLRRAAGFEEIPRAQETRRISREPQSSRRGDSRGKRSGETLGSPRSSAAATRRRLSIVEGLRNRESAQSSWVGPNIVRD